MSSSLVPAHFAAHLFTLTAAIGAAALMARRTGRSPLARAAGTIGFLMLAAAEAAHGGGFASETAAATAAVRTAGYLLILMSVVALPEAGLAATLVSPLRLLPPAIAAAVAGIGVAWKAGRERGRVGMAAGLLLIGAGESLLMVPRSAYSGAFFLSHVLRTAGWGSIALGVVSGGRRSIRFRMVAAFATVLLVVVVAVSTALTHVIAGNLRNEAVARVAADTAALRSKLRPLASQAALNVVVLARGLRDDLENGTGLPHSLAAGIRADIYRDLDFLEFLDGRGRVLQRSGLAPTEAIELAGTDVAKTALGGTSTSSLDRFGTGNLAVVGAAPVHGIRHPARVVGVVLAGFRVDGALLRLLSTTPALVVATRRSAVEASSVPGVPPGQQLPKGLLDRLETVVVEEGRPLGTTATLGPGDYFVSALPLQREDGVVVGAVLGTEPTSILAAAEQGLNRVLFLVTLVAVALAIVLVLLFARRLTGPVRSLTVAARRVREGDLDAKAPPAGEDEVGELSVAFNEMTESLGTMTASLREAAQTEARLRDQLETVLDSMGDGLVAVDAAGQVVTFNPAAERITGMSRARAMGKHLREVLVGRSRDGTALAKRENPHGEAFLKRRKGEIAVAISSAPIAGEGDEVLGRVFVIRDRSRESEIERMKREFLAAVSHELRTPLTPIVGYSELLTSRELPPERVAEFSRGILESAHRLERIVGMLVDYSAMEAGRMPVEPEPVRLKQFVTRAVDEWRTRAPTHRFVTRFGSRLPEAMVDVPLFRRTLDELLDNAVKYSPDGGKIVVSVSPNGRAPGRLNGRSTVRLEVTDQGIGISPAELQGIFQDFRQLDGSDTRAYGGLGLGLAFVRRIVKAHRGTIRAESEPGQGTTFTIELPAATSPNGGTPGNGSPSNGKPRRMARAGTEGPGVDRRTSRKPKGSTP